MRLIWSNERTDLILSGAEDVNLDLLSDSAPGFVYRIGHVLKATLGSDSDDGLTARKSEEVVETGKRAREKRHVLLGGESGVICI